MEINDKEIADWVNDCPTHKIEVLYSDETWGLLQIGQTKLALTVPSQHPPHVAFTVKELSDIPGVASVHRDGSISSYIEDPDGNSIEYIYWPPKT